MQRNTELGYSQFLQESEGPPGYHTSEEEPIIAPLSLSDRGPALARI